MKNFMLFVGNRVFPLGGIRDFIDCFNSIEDIRKIIIFTLYDKDCYWFKLDGRPDNYDCYDWYHIYDINKNAVVEAWEYQNNTVEAEINLDQKVWLDQEKYTKLGYRFEVLEN